MRAVVEHHGASADVFPPIKVLVSLGREDLTIKVSYQIFHFIIIKTIVSIYY